MVFSNEEKNELFSIINSEYFNHNFGTISKSEFELKLFSFIYDTRLKNDLSNDDFSLSLELGITQSRVRSFKEKMALRNNGYNEGWREEFIKLIEYAKYDDVKKLFKLHIPDINLLIQLRNFLESKHLYDEYQLNPKLFQCKADVLLEVLKEIYPDDIKEQRVSQIKEIEVIAERDEKSLSAIEKLKAGKIEDGIKALLCDCTKEVSVEILNLLPMGKIISAIVSVLVK